MPFCLPRCSPDPTPTSCDPTPEDVDCLTLYIDPICVDDAELATTDALSITLPVIEIINPLPPYTSDPRSQLHGQTHPSFLYAAFDDPDWEDTPAGKLIRCLFTEAEVTAASGASFGSGTIYLVWSFTGGETCNIYFQLIARIGGFDGSSLVQRVIATKNTSDTLWHTRPALVLVPEDGLVSVASVTIPETCTNLCDTLTDAGWLECMLDPITCQMRNLHYSITYDDGVTEEIFGTFVWAGGMYFNSGQTPSMNITVDGAGGGPFLYVDDIGYGNEISGYLMSGEMSCIDGEVYFSTTFEVFAPGGTAVNVTLTIWTEP